MKPTELKPGDRFRVADACDPKELVDEWETVTVKPKEVELSTGKKVVTIVDVLAIRKSDGAHIPLKIGPWVSLTLLSEEA